MPNFLFSANILFLLGYSHCESFTLNIGPAKNNYFMILKRNVPNNNGHLPREGKLFADVNNLKPAPEQILVKRNTNLLISSILIVGYMSIMVSIMSLPCSISTITSGDQKIMSQDAMSNILVLSTLMSVSGKFLLGAPTDHFGGHVVLVLTIFCMITCTLLASISSSSSLFGLSWMAQSFAYASGWGAVGKVVRESFAEDQWAFQISVLAAASRLGTLIGSLMHGYVLRRGWGWKSVFRVSAVSQMFSLIVYIIGLKALNRVQTNLIDQKEESNASKIISATVSHALPSSTTMELELPESIPEMLRRVMFDSRFILMLLARALLMVVGQFISFIPLYLRTGSQAMLPGDAAVWAAVFAVLFICQFTFFNYKILIHV